MLDDVGVILVALRYKLEIVVFKQQDGQMWQYLVQNDDRGEEVVDPELVSEIHERLAHLCSENEAPAEDSTPTFNPGQLEACDNIPDEDSRLYVIDNESKKIAKEVNLSGHQKLFNIRVKPTEAPYLCIRHDVDGILWKLNYENTNVCEHVSTLNAFGYVLASKQWKYSTCSPDFSYSVIAATKQNLFVYKQNCHVDSELRNRKTNQKFSKVGKQYLISLNTTDEILGLRATNEFVVVLTSNCVHLFDMKDIE
ncbi:hypothetical protein V9T40_011295 [Parthenolecanium corni]|uniref:NudC domain-containing protein 1 n=1 Tax=Parthenolecanium corni TaxID=536013 RepID=A0AAN9T8Q1_9HEMI